MEAIRRAIDETGSQAALAARIGVSQAAVSLYLSCRRRPSAEVAIRIEKETGGVVRADQVRPDIPWETIRMDKPQADVAAKSDCNEGQPNPGEAA